VNLQVNKATGLYNVGASQSFYKPTDIKHKNPEIRTN